MCVPFRVLVPAVLLLSFAGFARGEEAPIAESKYRDIGGYILNNNVWGKKDSPKGWEVIDQIHSADGKISWRVRYDWPAGANPHGVKCYPSVITGWHFGLWSSDGALPRTISSLRHVTTGATASVSRPGVQNVAYDLWFHAGTKVDEKAKPTDELMIWMQAIGHAGPLGKYVATVAVAGAEWRLNVGDIGWKVYSFVRVVPCDTWNVDAKAFIDCLVERGLMTTDKALTSVQFGTEVFRSPGEAEFQVKDYFVRIE